MVKMSISISTQGVATISGPVNTVAVPLIPNFSAAALATVSSVATAVCDQIQSKRSMGENNPLLVAMANDPIAVLTQNGLPAGLLAGVPQASKDNLISYLSSEANGEIAALRKRQVPRGFARCWACRIGFGVAFAIAGVVLTAATWGAAAPLFATAAAYMTMYLAIAASTAEGILVAAGGTASAGGIGALIEFICEAIPSTC